MTSAVAAEDTAPAVREVLAEIARMRDDDVSPEELADAKAHLADALPARFETVNDVTGALADFAIYDLPMTEYTTRAARLGAVTASDVRKAAQAQLTPAKMTVGDRRRREGDRPAARLAGARRAGALRRVRRPGA